MSEQTFLISAGGDDGYVDSDLSASTTEAFAFARIFNVGFLLRAQTFLRWDTSSLPEREPAAADLKVYVSDRVDQDDRMLVARWYDAGTIEGADYSATPTDPVANAGVDLGSFTVGAVNTIPLTNLSNINTGGYTGLRLHLTGGDAAAGNDNYLLFATFESASPKAQLVVNTLDVIHDRFVSMGVKR